MSVVTSQSVEVKRWAGRLLAIAGAVLLVEFTTDIYGEIVSAIPFGWMLTPLPFGIGFVLIPFVLLWSYRHLVDHSPTSAVVGVAFVAALPVGTIIFVVWSLTSRASGLVPDVTILPVEVVTGFFVLLALFAVGVATFGLTFLQHDRTRLLGSSLLIFASAWVIPLAVSILSGAYSPQLGDLTTVLVAAAMIAIGYCFPPSNAIESRGRLLG